MGNKSTPDIMTHQTPIPSFIISLKNLWLTTTSGKHSLIKKETLGKFLLLKITFLLYWNFCVLCFVSRTSLSWGFVGDPQLSAKNIVKFSMGGCGNGSHCQESTTTTSQFQAPKNVRNCSYRALNLCEVKIDPWSNQLICTVHLWLDKMENDVQTKRLSQDQSRGPLRLGFVSWVPSTVWLWHLNLFRILNSILLYASIWLGGSSVEIYHESTRIVYI